MPAYPQSNGQVEATNKTILNGLKKRLESTKGRWAKELPNMLWAYQTSSRRSTSKTPFSMTYGITEAVIPIEIGLPSMRTTSFYLNKNELLMAEQLDLVEENREILSIRLANYQHKLSRGYDRNVKP